MNTTELIKVRGGAGLGFEGALFALSFFVIAAVSHSAATLFAKAFLARKCRRQKANLIIVCGITGGEVTFGHDASAQQAQWIKNWGGEQQGKKSFLIRSGHFLIFFKKVKEVRGAVRLFKSKLRFRRHSTCAADADLTPTPWH